MADKDEKAKKKYAGKYDTEEELEKAYENLSSELGKKGASEGEMKKAISQYQEALQQHQQALQQHQAAVQQMRPVYDWVQQNQAQLQQFVQRGGLQQQAQQAASQTPGYELLTPAEKQAVISEAMQAFNQQVFAPQMQRFDQMWGQRAQQLVEQVRNEQAQMNRASSEVLYNIAQQIAPPEKWAEVQELLTEQVRFSDPSKFNPQEAASEHLKLRREHLATKAKLEQYEKDAADRERASTGSVNGTSPSLFESEKPAPKNRDERMAQTMTSFKNDVGREAANEFFTGKRT